MTSIASCAVHESGAQLGPSWVDEGWNAIPVPVKGASAQRYAWARQSAGLPLSCVYPSAVSQWSLVASRTLDLEKAMGPVFETLNLPPNWDGYGSPPPSPKVAEVAVSLLIRIRDALARRASPMFVCPVGGGGIQLEWHVDQKDLEIEIGADGSITYLVAWGNESVEGPLQLGSCAIEMLVDWVLM